MEVGKYDGDLPIHVTLLGKYRMNQVVNHFTITSSDVTPGTAQIVTSWYGDHIRSMLRYGDSYSFATINDIINLSIDQRILTPYTSFLIFYPDAEHGYCKDCIDETQLTRLDISAAEPDTTVEFTAFPNPFNNSVSLFFNVKCLSKKSDLILAIYNICGQQVYSKRIADPLTNMITWNGENESGQHVTSGLYFAMLQGPQIRKVLKLILAR
jgi:hypothetical protein